MAASKSILAFCFFSFFVIFLQVKAQTPQLLQAHLVKTALLAPCAPCAQGCATIFEELQDRFAEFVFFEVLTLPLLNNRRASFTQMNQLGRRIIARLVKTVKRYNPSLNLAPFRRSLEQLINQTARAFILNNLDQQQTRQRLQRHFKKISRFFHRFIFQNFAEEKINQEFRRLLNLMARLNRGTVRSNQAAYQTLSKSTIDIITLIKHR